MKAVLLSSIPLPYHKIGSWSKRYSELLSSKENPFDYVICPKLDDKLSESGFVKYLYAKRYKPEKLFKVYYRFYYYFFLKQLLSIIKKEKQLVIQIVDNVKLLNEVHDFLTDKKIRNKCVIIFNSCGYSYYFNPSEGIKFYDKIDHMIYSTNEAYQFEMNRYSYITSKVSIIPNGIDSIGFHKLTNVEKIISIGTVSVYPDNTTIPFEEKNIWKGYPQEDNAPYGIAKRIMHTHSLSYRKQYNFNSIMMILTNLYGPGDNFNKDTSHVIAALIRRFYEAKKIMKKK